MSDKKINTILINQEKKKHKKLLEMIKKDKLEYRINLKRKLTEMGYDDNNIIYLLNIFDTKPKLFYSIVPVNK